MPKLTEIKITPPREFDVLQLLGEGLKDQAIGEALGIHAHSVKQHISNLAWKMNLSSHRPRIALALAFQKAQCDEECSVSLFLLYLLGQRAGLKFTEKEMLHFT
jgi:DNA-binding NarL/FixJ family response regulator